MFGHMSRECPHELCFNCSQPGHQARQCPEPRGQAASTARCLRCGSLQHTDWTRCDRGYDEEDVARVMCYVCAELGHLCCAPVALDSWDDESGDIGSCFRCGEAGHVGARCTSALGGQPVCFRCNKVGHLARMCPLNQSRSGHFTLGMGFCLLDANPEGSVLLLRQATPLTFKELPGTLQLCFGIEVRLSQHQHF